MESTGVHRGLFFLPLRCCFLFLLCFFSFASFDQAQPPRKSRQESEKLRSPVEVKFVSGRSQAAARAGPRRFQRFCAKELRSVAVRAAVDTAARVARAVVSPSYPSSPSSSSSAMPLSAHLPQTLTQLLVPCSSPNKQVIFLSIDDITRGDDEFLLDTSVRKGKPSSFSVAAVLITAPQRVKRKRKSARQQWLSGDKLRTK